MTAPVNTSVQHIVGSNVLYIIFSEAIAATATQELDGFTFTLQPSAAPIVPTFQLIDQNAMIVTLPSALLAGESVDVAYVSGSGTIVDATTGLDPAASFTTTSVAYPALAVPDRAETGSGVGDNDKVLIYWGEPVGATNNDLLAGITININGDPLDLSGATATLDANQGILTIVTGVDPTYDDDIEVVYDAATPGYLYTWPTGAVPDFTLQVTNLSTDGLPTSGYPLSYVTQLVPVICAKNVQACVTISLNPIDQQLVKQYGPVTVLTGGTFGVTVDNPDGVSVVGGKAAIVDGAQICQTFAVPQDTCSVPFAAAAANDWLTVITARIGNALGKVRATDQGITLAGKTVEQV